MPLLLTISHLSCEVREVPQGFQQPGSRTGEADGTVHNIIALCNPKLWLGQVVHNGSAFAGANKHPSFLVTKWPTLDRVYWVPPGKS
jgi:hypothetical protein